MFVSDYSPPMLDHEGILFLDWFQEGFCFTEIIFDVKGL